MLLRLIVGWKIPLERTKTTIGKNIKKDYPIGYFAFIWSFKSETIDKILLSTGESIGGLFLPVKGYFASEQQRLAMRLGTKGGTSATLLINRLIFLMIYLPRRPF
jgi:hypothetical protein